MIRRMTGVILTDASTGCRLNIDAARNMLRGYGRVKAVQHMGVAQCGPIVAHLTMGYRGVLCDTPSQFYRWMEYHGPANQCDIPYGFGKFIAQLASGV
jgi:photosystem II stability/assembly factor-like uncharacterized protein